MHRTHPVVAAAVMGSLIGGIACAPQQETQSQENVESIARAVAVLTPTAGSDTRGTVTFTPVNGSIRVTAELEGLTPGGHGFHIHEFGDCSAPDGASAGGHFNPEGAEHGAPSDTHRHVGDLGNITADESGKAHYEITDARIAFAGPNSIIGRGVIVHAGEDDLVTQPTGGAGARVACGVVGIARQ